MPFDLKPGMRVLEAACCEEDWLQRAAEAWPDCQFTGVDVNAQDREGKNWVTWKGDLRDPELFEPGTFDAVVSLSAIEHIGLGHYGDPKDPDGDSKAVANIWTWLKPGGLFYFDVPYDPTGYRVLNTECRIYDDAAVMMRLHMAVDCKFLDLFDAYSDAKHPGTLIDKPTEQAQRYYYVAMCWRKA